MKSAITILLLFSISAVFAGNPYRTFLLTRVSAPSKSNAFITSTQKPICIIPHYQIPQCSIFCRMEDKLTKATGIWIKIGVK